jgi:hypothetical protein
MINDQQPMSIVSLAEQHVERLSNAILQAKQMAEGHKQKANEFMTQIEQLEAELNAWKLAIKEV